jgi:dipeptidase
LLTAARGRITPPLMRTFLRDHYDAGLVHRPRPVDDPHYFSLCMHADPLDNTTASMVVELPSDPHALPAARICLGSPCVGAFLPCYLDATVPSSLTRGGEVPEAQSSWWRMRELLTLVEQDFARLGPMVRARWDAFEETVEREARAVEDEAAAARRAGRSEAAAVALSAFMARTVAAHASCAETLIAECGGSAPAPRRVAQP